MTLSFRGPSAGAAAHNTNATQHKDEIDVSRAAARVCRFQGGSSHLSSEIVPITFFLPPQTFPRLFLLDKDGIGAEREMQLK